MTLENQLDNLLRKVLNEGVKVDDPRTGESTLALFDNKLIVEDGDFPWFTKNASSPRLSFEEMWFFLRGKTQTKELEDKGVFFWKGNTSKEALNEVGLRYLEEGELGAAYSLQWRNSGGYAFKGGKSVNTGNGEDQLASLLMGLRQAKYSRRHLVTLWNPNENHWSCITPCHHTSQYVVLPSADGDVLHVKLVNRSLDLTFGLRYAITQYRMLQMVLCKMFGFKLGKLSVDLSQYHIYTNQIEYVKEYLERAGGMQEQCNIRLKDNVVINDLNSLLNLEWSDWEMEYSFNKTPFKTERPEMVA